MRHAAGLLRAGRRLALAAVPASALGCAQPGLPDPSATAAELERAVAAGDEGALTELMSEGARVELGEGAARRLLREQRRELGELGARFGAQGAEPRVTVSVALEEGREATLSFEQGRYRIDAAGVLPSSAGTVPAALAELRAALEQRSFAALYGLLSVEARRALERELTSLVEALASPQALDVRVEGDDATVQLGGGHWVKLRREGGAWRVSDFE